MLSAAPPSASPWAPPRSRRSWTPCPGPHIFSAASANASVVSSGQLHSRSNSLSSAAPFSFELYWKRVSTSVQLRPMPPSTSASSYPSPPRVTSPDEELRGRLRSLSPGS